ncbi:tetratricopeptide repeat protein [Roseburia inulinivorans]|uniref:Stage V sporulation protein K n=1 Tax=Roseburia inulinivorans TaxID=360807 RepID=A0A173WAG9_9FIRM|nr:tetratricopeptide repeat protein [Roseburia inulinivorans]CUN36424.1 stage V sporulation protein K [Roseburia inulinivorans]
MTSNCAYDKLKGIIDKLKKVMDHYGNAQFEVAELDKYEYKLKLDQMKSLTAEGKYEEAAEIADTINWRKIKNINALVKVGEIYEKVGRYDESKDVLLTAYDKSPIGRMIIYRLAEVAVRTKSFDEAKEYYQEFVEIAPHDNLKYVLKYEISKAQGADIGTLIGILEELKEQEYSEEWAYELAYLYHKAGMSEKCIDACDELILWFGDGPYVERALELKMLYQPLTKQQEDKYRTFRQRHDGVVEVRPEDPLESGEIIPEPVQIKDVKMSAERFNTQNLQEELQRSMQEIMNATEKEAVNDTMDNIKKLVEDIPYLQIPSEKEEEPQEEEVYQHIETDEEIDNSLKSNFQEMLVDEDGQMSLYMQGGRVAEPQVSGQMSIEDVLAEWEKTKRAAEAALQEAEQRKLESAKARALQEAEELLGRLADVIPMLDSGLTPKDLLDQKYLSKDGQPNDSAVSMVTNMNQFLQQEIDRLSDENAQMDEQLAAVGASPVGDYMANAGVAAEDAAQNVVAAGVQELMAEEELPEIAMPEGLDDIDNQWEDEDFEELDAEVPQENAASLAEHTAEQTKPEALAEADDTMEAGTSAEDVEAAILAETARQMAKESVEKEELPEIELPGDLDLGKEETAEEILPAIAEPEAFEVPDTISKLSKELREIFTYFVPITGMEEQLCQALTGASQHLAKGTTAGTGNMIIQGGSGSGKTVLATSMIKALQKETGKPNGKIGKIEASVLNQKDVAALLKKVAGGCLIIEKAGDLSRETALKLSLLLEQDTSGVLVIIEDTKHGIQKALSRDDGFAAKFSEKINIPIFTSDELVSFAKSYANELGYTIDEMGVLALYNSISNIEHADRETTLTEVKEIVDKAVAHSEKGGLKKAFSIITSRRYDEDDYIILREKDFD